MHQDFLGRELSMSGFYGGLLSTASLESIRAGVDCNSGSWALDSNDPLDLVDNHVGTGVPISVMGTFFTCVDGSKVVAGSDLLAIKRTAAEASVNKGIVYDALTGSNVATWYMRTADGVAPVWQQHRPSDFLGGNALDSTLSYWEASARIFYLRSWSRIPGDNLPSLCMELLAGDAMTTRCLVEGVEDMQVELGIDSDSDGSIDRYLANPAKVELKQARVARIYLLVRSLSDVSGYVDGGVYQLGSREVNAPRDGYMRRVFSVTAPLHNFEDTRFAGAYE